MNKRQKKKFVKRNMLLLFPYTTNEILSYIFAHPDTLSINQLYRVEVKRRRLSNIIAPIHIPGSSHVQYEMKCKMTSNEPNPFKGAYVFTEGE
jgi:hypothetical protein